MLKRSSATLIRGLPARAASAIAVGAPRRLRERDRHERREQRERERDVDRGITLGAFGEEQQRPDAAGAEQLHCHDAVRVAARAEQRLESECSHEQHESRRREEEGRHRRDPASSVLATMASASPSPSTTGWFTSRQW